MMFQFLASLLSGGPLLKDNLFPESKFFPLQVDILYEGLCCKTNRKPKKLFPFVKLMVKVSGTKEGHQHPQSMLC